MSGNRAGGLKAAQKNKEKYGTDWYKSIGSKGGKNGAGTKKGWASEKIGEDGLTGKQRAKKLGAVGGSISKRGKVTK